MGEEDRGGLPVLDRKLRSGFFFCPDRNFASSRGARTSSKSGLKSLDKLVFLSRLFRTFLANFLEKSG